MNLAEPSKDRQFELAEERTRAAHQRTALAEERTYSAWVRTGLASAAAGLALGKLLGETGPSGFVQMLDALFIATGGLMFVLALWSYRNALRRLEQRPAAGVPVWPVWILALLSLALLAGALAGLWLVFQP